MPETSLGRRNVDARRMALRVRDSWAEVVRRVAESADRTDTNPVSANSVGSVALFGELEMRLSAEASALLRDLRVRIEPRLAEAGGDLNVISDWVSRYPGRVARIAALLHLAEYSPLGHINEATMRAALRIGEYMLAHAQAAMTGPNRGHRHMLTRLATRGETTITVRDVHRDLLHAHGPVEDAAALVDELVNLGALRALPQPEERGRGRPPSPTYAVHPDLVGKGDV